MSSEMGKEMSTDTSIAVPKPDDIAAALDEARQNARLLRVSSSLFLREAKELIDADRASVLVWASDFLDGSTEDAKERLQELQQSTTSCGLPSVSVESKKLLADLVGLGKIGGRLRRQAICLLAVVLDPTGEDAPALTKLLEQLPQGSLERKKSVPLLPPVTPSTKAAPSKSTVFRHHYTPDAPRFRAALSQKDSLPVLRKTGSLSSSRRSSDAGQAIHPETAQQNQKPAQIPEGAKLVDNHAKPKASTSASATAATGEPAPASGAALPKASVTPDTQSADEPSKGVATKPTQGLEALEPVKTLPHDSESAAKVPATPPASGAALTKASVTPDTQSADEPSKGVATKPTQGLEALEPVKTLPHDSESAAKIPATPPASGAALPKASVTPDVQSADEPTKGVATKPTQGLQASEPVKTLPHDSDSAAKLPAAPPASGAALPKATFISDAQAAAEPTKSVATKPTQGLQASEPVKALPRESSSDSNARIPATPSGQANGDAAKVVGIDEGAAAPPTPAKTTINQPLQPEASHTPQEKAHHKGKEDIGAPAGQFSQVETEPAARATVSLSQATDTPRKPASQKGTADVYTPGAGMPEAPRRASAEAAQPDLAARAGSIARPEEVSAFRMTRRRRSSSSATNKAPSQPEKAPTDAVKAMEPAALSSSPADASEDDDRPGHANGKVSAEGADGDVTDAPPSLQDMMVPPEMNGTQAAKAVWTGTSVEPSPSGNI